MLYSPSARVAFLHIHKTGGESLRLALQRLLPDLAHLPELPGAHHRIDELFDALSQRGQDPLATRVVTTICHPKLHAVSIYEYWRSDRIPAEEQALPHVALTRELGFGDFLDRVLVRDQFEEHLVLGGEVPPNVTILRRESLAAGAAAFLSDVTGRPVEVAVPHVNRTRHAPATTYFDDDTTARLVRSYRWTFDAGYYEPDRVPVEPTGPATGRGLLARLRARAGRR